MSWHWLFLINVIPGIIVTIAVWICVNFDRPDRSLMAKFDWWGLFSMALFLGAMEIMCWKRAIARNGSTTTASFGRAVLMTLGGRRLLLSGLYGRAAGRGSQGLFEPQFCLWLAVLFRDGHGLYGLPISTRNISADAGLDSLMIGETMFVSGSGHVCHGAYRRHSVVQDGPQVMMAVGLLASGLAPTW